MSLWSLRQLNAFTVGTPPLLPTFTVAWLNSHFFFLLFFKCTDPLNPGKTINHPSINERPSLGDKKKKNVSGATGALSVLSERPISSSATSYHPQRPEETTEIPTELFPAAAQSPLQRHPVNWLFNIYSTIRHCYLYAKVPWIAPVLKWQRFAKTLFLNPIPYFAHHL